VSPRDQLFFRVVLGAFILLVLAGAGMMFVVLTVEDAAIVTRVIGVFSGLASATFGFASGYLLGNRNGNGEPKQ
jgi:hypothetical protein